MGTTPAVPRPPEAPRSSHWVAIVLLSLALICVVSGITILLGLRFLSSNFNVSVNETAKSVNIKTPVGSFDVHKDISEAALGLPIYPGAQRIKEGDNGATINFGLPEHNNVRIVAGKYTTPDSLDKVRDYYQQQLGTTVTKFKDRDAEGKTVFEIKRPKDEKIVALKGEWGSTEIDLVRIVESGSETN